MDPSNNHVASWLSNAVGQIVAGPLLWLFVFCLLGVLMCLWAFFRFSRCINHRESITSATGSASLEFVLIIPFLLLFTLLLAQTTLIMGGNIFVHYAAFAASRSAITTIPINDIEHGEPRNYLNITNEGLKKERIRQAAVFALLPVAGRIKDSTTSDSAALVEGFKSYYTELGKEPPVWIDGFLSERLAYANRHTTVSLSKVITESEDDIHWIPLEDFGHASFQYGPREPITVHVEHNFYLSVPYVWTLPPLAETKIFGNSKHIRHTQIKAHYTLNNEGIDIELPPSPRRPLDFSQPLPRRD